MGHSNTSAVELEMDAERFPRFARAARWVAAVAIGALVAGVVFLVIVQTSEQRGWTAINFNHSLGVLIGGEATQARADQALGVSGDTAAPTGLLWCTFFSLALTVLYGVAIAPWLRRPWYVRGLPLAVVVWLLAMFVYMPKIDAMTLEHTDVGALGLGAGQGTPIVFAVGALGFGLLGARAFDLANSRRWWQKEDVGVHSAFDHIEGMEDLHREVPSASAPDPGAESGGPPPAAR